MMTKSSAAGSRRWWLVCLASSLVCWGNVRSFSPSTGGRPHLATTTTSPPSHIQWSRRTSLDQSASAATRSEGNSVSDNTQVPAQTRSLGSQELLMLPRQYRPGGQEFPQMNHVCAALLNTTPSTAVLTQALDHVMQQHPLLHARVAGDGEPDKRIDLFQMVREGNPQPETFVADQAATLRAATDLLTVVETSTESSSLTESWQASFQKYLDDGSWCDVTKGPLWKVELHRSNNKDEPCALVFAFNHAISDQSSANRLVDQLLQTVAQIESGTFAASASAAAHAMPVSLEESVLGVDGAFDKVGYDTIAPRTVSYILGKAGEGAKDPVILPDSAQQGGNPLVGALTIISGQTAGGQDDGARQSTVQFRTLSQERTTALLNVCRQQGVSMSNLLTAAVTYTATDFVGTGSNQARNYKVLQSLDMRRFGEQLDQGDTVACMAGSHDLMHGPLPDGSGQTLRDMPTDRRLQEFWDLAREAKRQTSEFIDTAGPSEAVRVFDMAMSIADLNNLVYLTAQSKDTMGRAYSAGVTNAGVYERQTAFTAPDAEEAPGTLQIQHGKYKVDGVFFATPHTQSGCLYPVSCLTVNGELQLTFHPVSPIVSEETNAQFADALVGLLDLVVEGTRVEEGSSIRLPSNALPLATAAIGSLAVLSHASAWGSFFGSVMEMKQNTSPEEFWPALNFWIFFAVGHPLLQPILWISDVLHGTPGPQIADLVPALFLAGNVAAIAAVSMSNQLRSAVNIAAVAAFFTYVGAGLDGTAGLGDFNLGWDDSYKGQVVKGCPAYEEVRQPSMDKFDLNKYQGLWYEQKFHDWTQFKEVYDTTLGIKLTEGGKGWIDDFAVKGPAPDAAPLSWDKSPVANGAHYFLFGRVDGNDPPGILREKGFGVEFPNYIVDVKVDPETGEYKEAIQFQCLERGGVRVFEGINFMSRNPTMTADEMEAMHERAKQAGMNPYGASPEQMHTVARRLPGTPDEDNSWQALWRNLGVDKLLELLTESIEDGGR